MTRLTFRGPYPRVSEDELARDVAMALNEKPQLAQRLDEQSNAHVRIRVHTAVAVAQPTNATGPRCAQGKREEIAAKVDHHVR